MPLNPGTRLGAYEIVSPLGAGGMGEVYRARDTKLGRDVAIKVVSHSFTYDPERVARFEREAQLLAALNHPHIASIYGLEQSEGAQFLVMELVEGDTLARRLSGGALPVAEALTVARQIADALQAAHDKGIIHRDLKPANIALTADGQVKVLDFGLAKALDPAPSADVANSPTLTLAATQAGVILGTAAYMAPEQAKGKAADKRSDLWAFGCVFYEMLTGRRAFDGDDVSDTMAAVLRGDPDWTAVPAEVPAAVRLLLRRCLEKDRRARLVDAGAAVFVLHEGAGLAAPAAAAAASSSRRWPLHLAAAAIAGALIATPATWLAVRRDAPAIVRLAVTTSGANALSPTGIDRSIAITPDGTRIVYRNNNQLVMRALDRLEPLVLSGAANARSPFVSPDGQWVAFFDGNPLRKIAITGGPAVTVTSTDDLGPRGGTWGPDGTIVFATNLQTTGLFRVSAAGGEATLLTSPNRERGEADHLWPEFLPSGDAVLFTITPTAGSLDSAQIAILDLRTGTSHVVLRGGSHAHYIPSGHLVYGVNGTLRAVRFDPKRREVIGTPAPVLEGVITTGQGAAEVAFAGNGTMVYVPGSGTAGVERELVWVDRTGREEPVPAPKRAYLIPRISPDGTRVALDVRDFEQDIWIWDFMRETLTRLTFDPALDFYPVWTPDSRRILFASARAGVANLFAQAADGTGSVAPLIASPNPQAPLAPTPDGTGVVIRETAQGTSDDVLLVGLPPAVGTRAPAPQTSAADIGARPLIKTTFVDAGAELSPDGRWLAYQSNESGRFEVYVRPFPGVDTGRWQVSTDGGRMPLWARNGRELFYLAGGTIMGVRVEQGGQTWRSTTPERVLQGQYFFPGGNNSRSFDVAPDGRRFLMIKQPGVGTAGSQNLIVVQHWFEELKRLVPAD